MADSSRLADFFGSLQRGAGAPVFQAVGHRRGLGHFLKDVPEIRRVVITAARRDVVELEIVITEEMLRAVNADVRQVVAERHAAVGLEQARQMVRRDAELVGDGIAGDLVLVMALQKHADFFEQRLRAAAVPGDGLPQQVFHAANQRADQVGERRAGLVFGQQFGQRDEQVRHRAADGPGQRIFLGCELRIILRPRGHQADAELRPSEKDAQQFQSRRPLRQVPAVRRGIQRHAGLQDNVGNFAAAFNLIAIEAVQRNFKPGKIDDVTEQRRIQAMAACECLADGVPLQLPGRPPVRVRRLAHAFEFICYKNEIKATYFLFRIGGNGMRIFWGVQSKPHQDARWQWETKKKRNSTPNPVGAPATTGYNRFLLFVAGLGGLLFGVDVGIIAGALPYLEATSGLNANQLSFIVAAVLLGGVISTLFAGALADFFGRKYMMIFSGVLFVVSVPAIALSHSYGALIFGRLLQGISGGLIGVVVPLYLAECLAASARGKGTGIFQWLLTLGIVAAAVIGFYFSGRVEDVAKLGDADSLF